MATRRTNGESNWPIKIICSPPKAARNAAPTIYALDGKQYTGVTQWHAWTGLLQQISQMLATDFGLGAGLAIVVLTLAMRTALLPITWSIALRAAARQAKLAVLETHLKALREKYATDRQLQMQKTLELYQQHGLGMADGKSLLGAFAQMPLILGLYQTLRNGVGTTAFLWIRNLGRPDAILAILAAVTTAVAMAVAPNMPEQMRLLLILLPAVFCLLATLHLSSGIRYAEGRGAIQFQATGV